jgi:hypothetical protein
MSAEKTLKSTFLVFVHFGEFEGLTPRLGKLRGIFDTYAAAVTFVEKLELDTSENSDYAVSKRMYDGAIARYSIHEVETDIDSGEVIVISV